MKVVVSISACALAFWQHGGIPEASSLYTMVMRAHIGTIRHNE